MNGLSEKLKTEIKINEEKIKILLKSLKFISKILQKIIRFITLNKKTRE